MAAFMPTSYEYLISESNLRMKINGGMSAAMLGDMLILGEEDKSYMIKDAEKTAYLMADDEDDSAEEMKPEVEKTDETKTISGYDCQKYIVKMKTDGPPGEAVQTMWMTEDLQIKRPKGAEKNGGAVFVNGVEGFPMMIETKTMGFTMVMKVTEVEKMSIPSSTFEIPKGYEIKDFNPKMFGR